MGGGVRLTSHKIMLHTLTVLEVLEAGNMDSSTIRNGASWVQNMSSFHRCRWFSTFLLRPRFWALFGKAINGQFWREGSRSWASSHDFHVDLLPDGPGICLQSCEFMSLTMWNVPVLLLEGHFFYRYLQYMTGWTGGSRTIPIESRQTAWKKVKCMFISCSCKVLFQFECKYVLWIFTFECMGVGRVVGWDLLLRGPVRC